MYYVNNEDVQEVHRKKMSHVNKAPVYLVLSCERARNTRAWDTICELYPPDHTSAAASFREKMKYACKKIWEHAAAHVYVILTLTIITVIAVLVVQYVKLSKEKPEVPKSEFSCTMCWLDQDEPYYSDKCPGSPDNTCAKGKGRRKYSNFVNVNSKKVKVSDLEDSSMEKTLHEARRILGETGYTEDSHRTTMAIKDVKYNIGYRWVDNQVEISIDMPDQNCSASSFDNNSCHLRNSTTGSRLYGLLLTESVVRFPNHLYQDSDDETVMMHKGKEYHLQSIAKFESNDCHYAVVVNKDGVLARVPGIKSLVKHVLPVSELDKIMYVGVHDPEGPTTVEMPYKYYVRLPQAYHDGQTRVEGMAGFCTYGDIPVHFLRPGACGASITTRIGSAEKISGQVTGIKPMYRAYVFPAITVEEWNRVGNTLDTSMSSLVPEIKATYMVPKSSRNSTTVYTPTRFMDKLEKRSDAEHQFEGGITTIASVPGNCLPIDQKCGKQPVMNLHFADLYGVQKYPVMNKSDIERKCQDKIPPDDAGMRQAENIKLVKARCNVTTSEHPCSEPDIAATFIQKACELAEYWKL